VKNLVAIRDTEDTRHHQQQSTKYLKIPRMQKYHGEGYGKNFIFSASTIFLLISRHRVPPANSCEPRLTPHVATHLDRYIFCVCDAHLIHPFGDVARGSRRCDFLGSLRCLLIAGLCYAPSSDARAKIA